MKFYGKIGFYLGDEETKPSVYKPKISEMPYQGDVNWNNRHFQSTENQNDDIKLNNQISILSDIYLQENLHSVRYVVWNNIKWRVTNVEMGYPRIILTIGGVYNDS